MMPYFVPWYKPVLALLSFHSAFNLIYSTVVNPGCCLTILWTQAAHFLFLRLPSCYSLHLKCLVFLFLSKPSGFFKVSLTPAPVGTSVVEWWIIILLPYVETWVWSLVREYPTCHRATKPMHCSSRAQKLQLLSPFAATTEAHIP